MKLTPNQRRMALGCALLLAIAVTVVFGDNEQLPTEPQVVPDAGMAPKAPDVVERSNRITLEKLNRTPPDGEGIDLFASKSWYAPPPPPVQTKPVSPPKPTAPPLPFSYVGQMEGKDGLIVYLARREELLSVKPGSQFDDNYRLEAVSAEQLTFVYLPLGERQVLGVGGKP